MASGTGAASAADIRHDWFVVDASGLVLGRVATRIARGLSGPRPREVRVNKRSRDDSFRNTVLKMVIKQPLLTTETAEKFDIHATVAGGGPTGQAGAVRPRRARGAPRGKRGAPQKDTQ